MLHSFIRVWTVKILSRIILHTTMLSRLMSEFVFIRNGSPLQLTQHEYSHKIVCVYFHSTGAKHKGDRSIMSKRGACWRRRRRKRRRWWWLLSYNSCAITSFWFHLYFYIFHIFPNCTKEDNIRGKESQLQAVQNTSCEWIIDGSW